MQGRELLNLLISLTGLPTESVERELTKIIEAQGMSLEDLNLNNFREILALYLQSTLVEAKSDLAFE